MWNHPSSPQDVIDSYQIQWEQAIASQNFLPFIFPYSVSNYGLLVLYLLYSRTRLARKSKYAIFTAIVWLSIAIMSGCRTLSLDYGVLIGIMSSWCIVWSSTLIIFHNPHQDFYRLVKTSRKSHQRDTRQNREVYHAPESSNPNRAPENLQPGQQTGHPDYVWEAMPDTFWKRFGWTLDLVTSLRGLHWSWRSTCIPSISSFRARPTQRRPFQAALWLIFIYLGLDVLNIIGKTDPYFWGIINPSESYLSISHTYHIFITFLNLMFANLAVFNIPPLLCVHILGPSILGSLSEPWMYSTAPGPIEIILNNGLQGFWNSWWHQMFRFGLSSPGVWLVDRLGIVRSSAIAKTLRITVAFALSGMVHACGCYTQWPATSSLKLFFAFMLQPVGMVVQDMITLAVCEYSRFDGVLKPAFVVFWLWLTFEFALDEYARGGMWLVEPLPFSPLRSLGFGPAQEGWWLWRGLVPHFHQGEHWWQWGLAL